MRVDDLVLQLGASPTPPMDAEQWVRALVALSAECKRRGHGVLGGQLMRTAFDALDDMRAVERAGGG